MYLKKIKLENFRNYKKQEIEFINGINLFLGNNAQGKTNIIESVYVCAFGKSYRTIKDEELIKFEEEFTRIKLEYIKNNTESETEIVVDNNNKKQIKNNGVKIKKIADYVGEIPIVMFSPESLDIVKGSPSKRRNFLDMICCQLSKSYIISLQEYAKCLKMKNNTLKNDYIDETYISILHEKMSIYIKEIVGLRKFVVEKLLEKSETIEKQITDFKENIELIYRTDFLEMEIEEIRKYLDEHLYVDKLRKSSVKGIQKDDIDIYINEKDVSKYGSQGQKRTALLTLKLANFELLKEEKDEDPILLLDDIMSELDSERIHFLLEYIQNYQSIITTTEDTFIRDIENIKISKVSNGTLEI